MKKVFFFILIILPYCSEKERKIDFKTKDSHYQIYYNGDEPDRKDFFETIDTIFEEIVLNQISNDENFIEKVERFDKDGVLLGETKNLGNGDTTITTLFFPSGVIKGQIFFDGLKYQITNYSKIGKLEKIVSVDSEYTGVNYLFDSEGRNYSTEYITRAKIDSIKIFKKEELVSRGPKIYFRKHTVQSNRPGFQTVYVEYLNPIEDYHLIKLGSVSADSIVYLLDTLKIDPYNNGVLVFLDSNNIRNNFFFLEIEEYMKISNKEIREKWNFFRKIELTGDSIQ